MRRGLRPHASSAVHPPRSGRLAIVDYTEVRAAFFQPRAESAPVEGTSGWRSAGRRLRDAIEPIATICWWAEPAYDAYAAHGLDFLQGYVYSRGCVLGEAEGDVVAAAFGVFEPGLNKDTWSAARSLCSLAGIRAARVDGSVAALREVLGDTDVEHVGHALRDALCSADPTGRALFAGAAGLPWPDDLFGQLWHACVLLREYRGDGHVATCVATGLSGLEANLLTVLQVGWPERSYTGSRGWSPETMDLATALLGARGLVAGGACGANKDMARASGERSEGLACAWQAVGMAFIGNSVSSSRRPEPRTSPSRMCSKRSRRWPSRRTRPLRNFGTKSHDKPGAAVPR